MTPPISTPAAAKIHPRSATHPAAVGRRLAAWWRGKNLSGEFWKFLGADFLYDSGTYVFFLLYNLYLLDLGYREGFLGWAAGMMAAGSIVGSLPAGLVTGRCGLRKSVFLCFTLVPATLGLSSVLTSAPWLLALAFLSGVISSLWGVTQPLIVAHLTDDENRPFAFSVIFAAEIGFGILAGILGGYLPAWLARLRPGLGAVGAKREAILLTCGLSLLALWPASRLKLSTPAAPSPKRHYPRNAFVWRFLVATGIWSFATNAFNPFFNAYFARGLGASVERIGVIVSASRLTQVVAMLAAPALFRRCGLLTGVLFTQIACAAALESLAAGTRGWSAAAGYCGYMGFQWMSDPAFYSLLMTSVAPPERAGASAMYLLVVSVVQAVAAAVAGQAFARFGYPRVMAAIGAAIFLAALLFRSLLSGSEAPRPLAEAAPEIGPGGPS